MSQNEFEIVFPTEAPLSIDITDKSLYRYDLILIHYRIYKKLLLSNWPIILGKN